MSLSRLIARIFMVPIGLFLAIMGSKHLSLALPSTPCIRTQVSIMIRLRITCSPSSPDLFWPSPWATSPFILPFWGLIIAEIFSWRSLWLYLGYGLVLSFFMTHVPGEPIDALAIALDVRALASGLIGGFVYWLIAGRGAGIVKRSPRQQAKEPLGGTPLTSLCKMALSSGFLRSSACEQIGMVTQKRSHPIHHHADFRPPPVIIIHHDIEPGGQIIDYITITHKRCFTIADKAG